MSVFEDAGEADVIYDTLPIERIDEVAQAFVVDDAGNVVFVGQGDGFGAGDAEAGGQRRLEEFVVGGPHEGIVDDGGAAQGGVFEIGAVVGDFVGDAVNDDGVVAEVVHAGATELDEFGGDALIAAVDFFDELGREGPLPPDDESNFERHGGTSW